MTDQPSEWALREAEELIGGDGDRYFISQEEIEAVAAALDAARRAAHEQCAAWHDTAALESDQQAQITLSSELRGRHLANARLHRYSAEQIRALADKEPIATDAAEAVVPTSGGEDAGGGTQRPAPRHPQSSDPTPQIVNCNLRDPMRAAVRRAVMLCKDERFRRWYWVLQGDAGETRTAEAIRAHCGITSRAEIATDRDAYERFLALEVRYRADTGQMAEQRG